MTIAPEVLEQFTPWSGSPPTSPDGIFRINGPWTGTGGNFLTPANAQFLTNYPGSSDGDVLALTVLANEKQGAELQSLPLGMFGYGYYESSMEVTPVSGVVVSFFTIQAPNYGPQEIDIEFLTNEAGFDSSASHVHFTLHPSGMTFDQPLSFNPTTSFHDYGFLWTPGEVQFTVDGTVVHTFKDPQLVITPGTSEYVMANTWTGNPNWGGGPPTQNATSEYDWIKYWPNVTTVPDGSSNGSPVITAPATVKLGQDQSAAIAGVSLSESGNTSGETFSVQIKDTNGNLSASGTGVSGSGTRTLTISGSLTQVNSDLATLSDTDAVTPSDTINITASDSLGNTADPQQIAVTVTAPVTVPDTLTATQSDGTTGPVPIITTGSSSTTIGIGTVLQTASDGVDTVSFTDIKSEQLTLGSDNLDMSFISPHLLTVIGGSGDDTITANNGTNHFTAGTGTLDVSSGTGWSTFFYNAGDGLLRIEDFTNKDWITIDGSLKASMTDGSDGHGGVMLSFGVPGHGIDLVGLSAVPTSKINYHYS